MKTQIFTASLHLHKIQKLGPMHEPLIFKMEVIH